MPFFRLKCGSCKLSHVEHQLRRLVPPPKCGNCGGEQDYVVSVSTRVVETIDTGAMVRPVEQLQDVEKLHKDRAEQYEKPDEGVAVKLKP